MYDVETGSFISAEVKREKRKKTKYMHLLGAYKHATFTASMLPDRHVQTS